MKTTALADRLARSRFCTVDHEQIKRSRDWYLLRLVGFQHTPADRHHGPETLELRDCACGSTLAKLVINEGVARADAERDANRRAGFDLCECGHERRSHFEHVAGCHACRTCFSFVKAERRP